MHEVSLTESIVEIVVEEAKRLGASRVTRVFVDVGVLSHVKQEALLFCFAAVSAGTLAEGAELEITRIGGSGWCADCRKSTPLTGRYDPCPECGGYQVRVTGGDDFRLREIEIG